MAVTISGGVGVFPQHGYSPDLLVQATDLALYRAKAGGRNAIAVARSESRDTELAS